MKAQLLLALVLCMAAQSAGAQTNWGRDVQGSSSTAANHSRAMGGTSPNVDNMRLTSISIYLGAQTGDVRLAVYTGGSLNDPSSATLLWDAGTVNPNGTAGLYTINHPSGGVDWPKNTVTWLAWKRDNGVRVFYSNNSADAGDFQAGRGRNNNNFSRNPGTAFPSTYGNTGSFSNFWYSIFATYSVAAVDHFSISHDGSATTCDTEEITIARHDSTHAIDTAYTGTITLSTSTSNGDWSLVSGSGTLTNSGNGSATYTYVGADSGSVVLGLLNTNAETLNIDVTDGSDSEDSSEDADLPFDGSCSVLPLADWHLDDCTLGFTGSTVIDSGPNGLDGITVGGMDVENNGQLCSTGDFDGNSGHVAVPDSASLDVTDGFSVAVWVRHDGSALKDWEAILAKGDSAYRLHLNGGCSIADTLPGNTRHGITLGLNGGCAGADLNSNVVPLPGTWYHVAATYDRSVIRIYINGNLVNSASYGAAINTNNFDLFIGENSQQNNRHWSGDIDELTIWDIAITPQAVITHRDKTRPCSNCGGVEFIINHDNFGINCLDETLRVDVVDGLAGTPRTDYNAEITLDTQTGHGTWSLVSGGGTLTDATANDGLATYDWPAGESFAEFALSYTDGTASFDIDAYQTSDPATRDDDSEGNIDFSPSGFTLTAAALSNPPPAVIVPFSATQVAGTDFPIHIAAYGQTPNDPVCGIVETYTGPQNLKFWSDFINPVGGSLAVSIDTIAIPAAEASAADQSVTFANGQAVVTGKYKDVGRIQINVKDDSQAHPDLPNGIRGATTGFVVKPYQFVLSNIEDGAGNPNPAAADASGGAFVQAGEAFSVTVTAMDAEGDVTPNYGQEIIAETVLLTTSLVDPAVGDNPPLGAAFGPFVAGQSTGTNFNWPEVGIVTLTPSVGDADYLGAGNVTGATSGNVGRFFAHHFTTTLNTPTFATSCSSGSFTYIGESFTYSNDPVITVTARALAGEITENYAGGFFKIDNTSLPDPVYTSTPATLDTSGLPPGSSDPAVASTGAGVGTLTFSSGSGLAYIHGAPQAPFDADIRLSIDVLDTDGAAATGNPIVFGTAGGILFDAGENMRYGRGRLQNAYGSELVDLALPFRTEYFVDTATGFVPNVNDSCTTSVSLSLGAFTENLSAGETCVMDTGAPGDSGAGCAAAGPPALRFREPPLGADFNLHLRAPGAGNDGSTTATADVPDWLEFDWDTAIPGLEDPAGTAVFGIFRGADRRIYIRELY
ncbi:MAG: hypothetical protein GY783_12300 [Gammaproteobacteria bacterium]|nr:hypothetical protein [Gammaproteobacteria bacterium]